MKIKLLVIQFLCSFLALAFAWVVLILPGIKQYAFQAFCILIIVFIVVNIWGRHQKTSVLVNREGSVLENVEIALVGSAILLLIANTGGLGSDLLPLFYIYFFFATFVNPLPLTLVMTAVEIIFFSVFTVDFSFQAHYGSLLAIVIFVPIAFFAQKYYNRAVKDGYDLALEKEKVAYYNMYAEKKQNELLARDATAKREVTGLYDFLQSLIPEIDALQGASRFAQNQLVVSERLTKIGLSLRRALKLEKENSGAMKETEAVTSPSLVEVVETKGVGAQTPVPTAVTAVGTKSFNEPVKGYYVYNGNNNTTVAH
jgi:multisubunit Na+/H+ antiporter MnhC subunit